MEIRFVVQDSI